MHSVIREHKLAIAEVCRAYHVQRLEVFGSAARGIDFDPNNSDVDFLVEFTASPDIPTLKTFFGLRTDLSKILGCEVDLAETSAIRNPYIQASINRECEVVYGKKAKLLTDWRNND